MSSMGSGQKVADKRAESSTPGELEPGPATTDRNERIREIAYFMWLDEGCPEGEEQRHWTTAETMVESEPSERKQIEGEPPGEPVRKSAGSRRETRKAAE